MKIFILLSFLSVSMLNSFSQDLSSPRQRQKATLDKTPAALGISAAVEARIAALNNPPVNIALFGVDRRDKVSHGNADMIMVVSIDRISKKVKLSSIMRDTYVSIDGGGMDKINAAFATGGPQLAIKTLNENFSLDIHDYLSVDFFGSAKIIDALGGVTLNVKEQELPYLNNYLAEIAAIEGTEPVKLSNAGMQKLNGKQTVAYSRIRAVGNNDYERTARQRMVMSLLLDKLKNTNPETFSSLAFEILPNIDTSLSGLALYSLGSGLLNSGEKVIQEARFPLDNQSKGVMIKGIWYLSADLKQTTASLHNFIYKDIKP